jgi:hypothetical protein
MGTNISRLHASTTSTRKDDPLRLALVDAIGEAEKARKALDRQKAGIERLQKQVWAGDDAIAAAQKAVEKAQKDHVDAIAAAAALDAPTPASTVPAARKAVVEVQEQVEAARAALTKLQAGLADWEREASEASTAVEAAISAILAPHVIELVKAARKIADQLTPIKVMMTALLHDQQDSPPPAQQREYFAFEKGRQPLEEAEAIVRGFFQDTRQWNMPAANPWNAAREKLRLDPLADISGLINCG